MSISIPGADYTPQLAGYTGQGAFRFWCQKVLPIVYDDSLSYYELLNKVVNYLNNVIKDVATVESNVAQLGESYVSLQNYVNQHFNELESFVNELEEFVDNYFENLDVQNEINAKLNAMASDGTLSQLIEPIVITTAPDVITQWLDEHITPTMPVVDSSLTISGAAADAKVTGDKLRRLDGEMDYLTNKIFFDWKDLGIKDYPLGWKNGYYNSETGEFMLSHRYIATTNYITPADDVIFFGITAPEGYSAKVYEYDGNNVYIGAYGAINIPDEPATRSFNVQHTKGHKYNIAIGRFSNDDSEQFLTQTFISDIYLGFHVWPDYGISRVTYDWADYGDTEYPTGWRSGYYGLNDGRFNPSNYYIATAPNATLSPGNGKLTVTAPVGYAVAVFEYDLNDNFIQVYGNGNYSQEDATPTVTVDTRETYIYKISLGRFARTDSGDYVTDSFVSTIIGKFTSEVTEYKSRTAEMEFFTVVTNTSVPTEGSSSNNEEGYAPLVVNGVLALPESYTPNGEPTPVIMLCHGQSARVDVVNHTWFGNSADFLRLLRGFTSAGYAVFDVGSTNPDSPNLAFADWGNPALMSAYIKAWNYVNTFYNTQHKISVFSESMGTQAALNIINWYPSMVKTAVMAGPRTDIQHYLDSTTLIGGYPMNEAIRMRYGITGDVFPDRLIGYNHQYQIIEISNKNYLLRQTPPIKVLIGGDDDPDYTLLQAEEYFSALRNAGNVVYCRTVSGAGHHAICYLTPGDVLQEVVTWFNRYN